MTKRRRKKSYRKMMEGRRLSYKEYAAALKELFIKKWFIGLKDESDFA